VLFVMTLIINTLSRLLIWSMASPGRPSFLRATLRKAA
jgi:hypothetical protein